nr:sodium-independent anion transporter [Bathymodiolus platifrons methanotrophic gill symbiont]
MSRSRPEVEIVILCMESVSYIDLSGVYALKEAVTVLQDRNIKLLVTGLQAQPKDMLTEVRMIPYIIPEDALCRDFQSAIKTLSASPAPYHYPQKNEILIQA